MTDPSVDILNLANADAERCVVNSFFLADDGARTGLSTMLRAEHFSDAGCGAVWRALCDMHRAGRPMDAAILIPELKRRQALDDPVGGVQGLAAMLNAVPSAAAAEHYARIVLDLAVGRWTLALADRAIRRVRAPGGATYADIARQVEREFSRLSVGGAVQAVSPIGDVLAEWWAERGARPEGGALYVPTGMLELDDIIGGLGLGKFILIAARAHMGKSAFAKQLLLNIADAGTPCGIVSIEEDRRKIAANVTANLSGVQNDRLMHGTLSDAELGRVADSIEGFRHLPIYVNDSAYRLAEIEAAATTMAVKHGCRVIVVDHLHLADAEIDANRERQVAHISGGLKRLGKRLGVAMVGLCQLNRGGGGADEYARRPTTRDLRDSGALEADGDVILMLHREDYYRSQKGEHDQLDRKLECLIRKNKDGSLGDVPLCWDPDHQRITQWVAPVPI